MTIIDEIKTQIETHPILLYMKGTPDFPQCGFSSQAVQALKQCNAEFTTINILERQDIRQALPQYADWPTFPQLYIQGELIGGADIIIALVENGELQTLIDQVQVNS